MLKIISYGYKKSVPERNLRISQYHILGLQQYTDFTTHDKSKCHPRYFFKIRKKMGACRIKNKKREIKERLLNQTRNCVLTRQDKTNLRIWFNPRLH